MSSSAGSDVVRRWHGVVESRDAAGLEGLLAEDAVFESPVVHTPQRGKEITTMYLTAAMHVLGGNEFRYVREIVGERDAALEFTTVLDGIHINGIDLFHWNAEGRIDNFKVMIRPLKAVNHLHRLMGEMLAQFAPSR